MKYPLLQPGKTREWQVEALGGGCNRRDGSRRTPDNQLTELDNLWWQNGALRTRPGLCAREDQCSVSTDREISWKFCLEDTVCGALAVRGRRFLRRVLDKTRQRVLLQTGVLTYDGRFLWEGSLETIMDDVTGMVMEYPYTATENVLIFLSTGEIYAQDSTTCAWRDVTSEAYVPTILVGGEGVLNIWDMPNNTGIRYEGRNMLTGRFCAKYTTTQQGFAFHFPLKELDQNETVEISISYNDGSSVHYTVQPYETTGQYAANDLRPVVDRNKGMFYFESRQGSVIAPVPGFANNMVVYASKSWTAEERQRIPSMQFSTWFGGSQAGSGSRQFISGSSKEPNRLYWSGQGQPLYFPETNYIAVGDINQAITAFGKQDGMLVIFKEREIYGLSGPEGTVSENLVDGHLVQNVTATSDYFPLTLLHAQIGCQAPQSIRLCGSRLVWADGTGGIYTLIGGSGNAGSRVRELSSLIEPELRGYGRDVWQSASAAVLDGHYLLLAGHTVYALRIDEKAFHRYASAYNDEAAQQQLAWFIWTLPDTLSYLFLCGNGQEAVTIGTRRQGSQQWDIPLYFQNARPDRVMIENGWEDQPIVSRLCTKEYDCGCDIRKKRILRVQIGIEAAEDADIRFGCFYDGAAAQDAVTLRHTRIAGDFYLAPNCARVRRFGCAMEAVGTVAVDSLSWTYRC